MNIESIGIIVYWTAVCCYVLASILMTSGVFMRRPRLLNFGCYLTAAGLVPHTGAILLRWYVAGHGPYLGKFEAISSTVWVVMLMFLVLTLRRPDLRPLGVVILPAGFLMLATGIMSSPEIRQLPVTFHTIWLIIHILFAKLTLGVTLFALGCAVFYLYKQRDASGELLKRLPDPEKLDRLSYQFCGMAFVFWTITVIAGAIWAERSWGRYWGWDPIETWSLVTWLVFGFYMHLRRFHGLHGRRAAWFTIGCFLFIIISLLIVPIVSGTIHTEYLQ